MSEIKEERIGTREDGSPHMVRVMTPLQIRERNELNVKNTATAARQRVLAELAKRNGI